MKLTKSMIKQILKEEYEKRIAYFLSENIPRKDARGVDVLQGAKNLKIREKKGGGEYIFDSIVNVDGKEFGKVYFPDTFRDTAYGQGAETSLTETDDFEDGIGFYSRLGDKGREIEPVDDDYDQLELLSQEDEENFTTKKGSKPKRNYMLVPVDQLLSRFEVQ